MRFVILGCGRVGSQLAAALYVEGHEIAIIDKDEDAFKRLNPSFQGQMVTGIGFDRDVLVSAGIEKADGFASVTNGDNSNIISALIAKRVFQVPRVITRIYDPARASIYRKFGIPTISSTVWGANELREHLLYAELKSELSFGSGEVELLEFEIPVQHVGRTVNDLSVDGQAIIACVVRLGTAIVPTDSMVFDEGDLVYASVSSSFLGKYKEMAGY